MPKFVTIGYGDREGYDRTDPAAHAHDAQLSKARGSEHRRHTGAGTHHDRSRARNISGAGIYSCV